MANFLNSIKSSKLYVLNKKISHHFTYFVVTSDGEEIQNISDIFHRTLLAIKERVTHNTLKKLLYITLQLRNYISLEIATRVDILLATTELLSSITIIFHKTTSY